MPTEAASTPNSEDQTDGEDTPNAPSKKSFYRPATELPFGLINHTLVYFDTKSYHEAIDLLSRLLEPGTSVAWPNQRRPAYVPPGQQIELAATLIVHPETTTRAKSSDLRTASNEALKYLRTLNKIVGPVNADFTGVFSFNKYGILHPDGSTITHVPDEESGSMRITTKIANSGSLFAQADNFWHVVGWAFNCSIKNKHRWERWESFIQLMLDVLEDDWAERVRILNSKSEVAHDETEKLEIIRQSLISKYLSSVGAHTTGGRRKMLRAIFADGTMSSLNEFGEVWRDETRELSTEQQANILEKRKMDVDMDFFGDYDVDDEEEDDGNRPTLARRSGRQLKRSAEQYELDPEEGSAKTPSSGSDLVGGVESLHLRQRLLNIVLETTPRISNLGLIDREDLLETYAEHLRTLPCSVFILLLSTTQMFANAQRHFYAIMATSYLPSYPPQSVDISNLSVKDLQSYFIPQCAKTSKAADNAKLSLLIEMILRISMRETASESGDRKEFSRLSRQGTLRKAVEKGIKARADKITSDSRKKNKGPTPDEAEAKDLLEDSSERLLLLVEMI